MRRIFKEALRSEEGPLELSKYLDGNLSHVSFMNIFC